MTKNSEYCGEALETPYLRGVTKAPKRYKFKRSEGILTARGVWELGPREVEVKRIQRPELPDD